MKTALILPAMNEARSISRVVVALKEAFDLTIIVIDDGSVDDTAHLAKASGAIVIKHVANLGAWRATQTGIRYALKKGYERVVTCDADGQHTAEAVSRLLKQQNYVDCLIGACTSRGSAGRHITWRFFKALSGVNVTDLTSGLRLYNSRAMRVLASKQATMFEYQDVGVLLMLKQLGMKVEEVPVQMNKRENGISRIFHSWVAVFRYLIYTLVLSLTKIGPQKADVYHAKLTSKVNSE